MTDIKLRRRRNRNLPAAIIGIVFSVAVIIAALFKMRFTVISYAASSAETIMLNSANKAAAYVLKENNIKYSDIVNLSNNADGYVTSLEIDVYEVNILKSDIAVKTAELIAENDYYSFSVPFGAFFGSTYTSGLGPMIKFKMKLSCTAKVDFSNDFRSAGINQVLHVINIDSDLSGNLIIAGYNKGIGASTSTIAAQTVIVGKTPNAYTNVVESETDNTAGLINDYGAIAE